MAAIAMARLVSVNVGMPRDIAWRGKTVRTGIWKQPVEGRRRVRTLNVEGDGQGDLAGHGGEQRAVFVYQTDSYRYWQARLRRDDLVPGQFGENFTVDGLPDAEVCIGDRYRIGTALFEVTQPRTTCYRVGIRLDVPQMAAMLTSSGRPGFYFRVIEEGDVAAGDPITLVSRGAQGMTVAVVNGLLYLKDHPHELLERVVEIAALSPGWHRSFEALLQSQATSGGATGAVGLTPVAVARSAATGFRRLQVARSTRETADVLSLVLQSVDDTPLALPVAGQFVILRLCPGDEAPAFFRSYSLSGPASVREYRISAKVEPHGLAGAYLGASVHVGDVLDVSEPRGNFTLQSGTGPIVLLSAGIGATPVLAMLHALAESATTREVWWLHGARNRASHSFAAETRALVGLLAHARSHVWYSRPDADDRPGIDYDVAGRARWQDFAALGVPREADYYLCGPAPFLASTLEGLGEWGVGAGHLHSEVFGAGRPMAPGVVASVARPPHQPEGSAGTGPVVSFARSGVSTRWRDSEQSLLELAEACDVPARWSCRSGVCHNCETGLVSGRVHYQVEPLQAALPGNILICCSRPLGDIVIDL
jgi:MOSC domain-containing protein YiiM/ferredoxin-NADP reductase